jgi:hypothetical protein
VKGTLLLSLLKGRALCPLLKAQLKGKFADLKPVYK